MNYDALIAALQPLVQRVRTDVTAVKQAGGTPWTREPLTTQRLRHHLNGGPARGVCPIKAGEDTAMVGLLDFDSHKGESTWAEMQAAAVRVMDALRDQGLTPIPWRSSGGRGIHVFVLWDTPQDAYTVRQVLTEALAAAGFRNGPKGVARGEVEVFPKQDAVPVGGYGNQFILPLAGKSEPLDAVDLEPMGRDPDCIVWPSSPPLARRAKSEREPLGFSESADLAQVRSALAATPNSGEHELDYDQWRNVIFAVHHATGGSDEGLALAHEFSGRSGKYNPEFLDQRVWPYVRDRENGITEGTLFALAREHGWNDTKPEDFEVVDTAAIEAAEAAKPSRFQVLTDEQFMATSPPRWIVKGLVPEGDLVVLYGESGAGKSFVALDIFGAVARGVPWRGRRVRQQRVCFVVAEGSRGFRNRLCAYAQHHGERPGVKVIAAAPNLMKEGEAKDVIKALVAAGGADIIVVDTFAQTTPGANENSGEDVGRALANCKAIGAALGALVVLVHHAGKDASKGARGWSGLKAAADAEIEVTKGPTGRQIRTSKQKDGEDDQRTGFSLERVTIGIDEDGDEITSCVVMEAEIPSAKGPSRKLGEKEMLLNEVIQTFAETQTTGIEREAVLDEAMRRLDPPAEKRKSERNNLARAFKALVECVENYAFDPETKTLSVV